MPVNLPVGITAQRNSALQPESEEQNRQLSRFIELVNFNAFWQNLPVTRFIMLGLGFPLLVAALLTRIIHVYLKTPTARDSA